MDSKFRDLQVQSLDICGCVGRDLQVQSLDICGCKVLLFADAWVERAGPELSVLISTRRVAVNSFRFNSLLTPQVAAAAFFPLSTSYSPVSY